MVEGAAVSKRLNVRFRPGHPDAVAAVAKMGYVQYRTKDTGT